MTKPRDHNIASEVLAERHSYCLIFLCLPSDPHELIPRLAAVAAQMIVLCRCSSGEAKLNIPEGVLKKTIKSKEQKEKELEEVCTSASSSHSTTHFHKIADRYAIG